MMVKLEQAGVILAMFLLSCVSALYEDQIKKFDWRLERIGAIREAHLDLNAIQPRLIVHTHQNVIASLCPKTGEIVWRQVLGENQGKLKFFHLSSNDQSSTAAAFPNSRQGYEIITVQGYAPATVRAWNSLTGCTEMEWSIMPLQTDKAENAFVVYSSSMLYHVVPTWRSHLEITPYFVKSGQTPGTTSKVMAPWITAEQCVVSGVFYVCLEGKQLLSLDLTDDDAKVFTKKLDFVPSSQIETLKGANGIVIIDNKLFGVKEDIHVCKELTSKSFYLTRYNQREIVFQTDVTNNVLNIRATDLEGCKPMEELSQSLPYPEYYGSPSIASFDCKVTKKNNDGKICFYVLNTADESIILLQQNKIRWVREEALSDVVAAEFIDLPLADSEGTLEKEIKGQDGDITSAFVRRISTQIAQIKSIFFHVVGLGPPPSDTQKAGLVRDAFGLHKMLVFLTKSGKVFGVDNVNGKIHWQFYLPQLSNFAHGEPMRLVVQRTSKHFPLPPLCLIVAKHAASGNGLLYHFNPITGKQADEGLVELEFKIKQMAVLAESEHEFIKGVLIIDTTDKIHVYPESSKSLANGMYLFTADKKTSILNGFHVSYDSKKKQLSALPVWNIHLGGFTNDHQIMAIAAKNPIERVHSQGRVLSDRSVLYKYINPNLVAVITQAFDPIHKSVLNVYLVDVVSGSIVFSMVHRRVSPPVQIVHSENWLAYTYYNDKVRRNEITTVELYEGKNQANGSVWSSLNAPPMPLVERQSYIMPAFVQTMRETITERGITNKHVLIGTATGSIIEMPWALLDPRRPVSSTTQGREEGAIPYIPELPIPTENIINYNQTIKRLHNIYTAPSGLESTCLVVATGLDIFVTRVAPSKTFDLLKEDFDYMLISLVLIALTMASLVVKDLASKKLLKQAWK